MTRATLWLLPKQLAPAVTMVMAIVVGLAVVVVMAMVVGLAVLVMMAMVVGLAVLVVPAGRKGRRVKEKTGVAVVLDSKYYSVIQLLVIGH